MTASRTGMILIVSGPSGSGKSTIASRVMAEYPELSFSVSCTTRAPRPGEVDGKSYYFITKEKFEQWIGEDLFIEHAFVHGNYYGTLKSEVLNRIRSGTDVLLDIDVQGASSIRELCRKDPEFGRSTEFVFIAPPSPEILEQRLRNRGTETEESIQRRTRAAKEEMTHIPQYDYLVINDDLDRAAEDFRNLYCAFRLSTRRMKGVKP